MPIIKFLKEKKEAEVPLGTNLRKAALEAGVNPHSIINGIGAGLTRRLNCFGNGLCGTCRVNIVKGMENVSPMGIMEKIKFHNPIPDPLPALAYVGNEDKLRLACQTLVNGDIEVETAPPFDLFGENFFQLSGLYAIGTPHCAARLGEHTGLLMKQVVAIVKPFLAEQILEGLRRAPLEAVHVREVKGMGRQKSYLDEYAESEYAQAFLPKVEITAWVEDARAEEVIRKMVEVARTGRMGDGKIFVLSAQSYESVID